MRISLIPDEVSHGPFTAFEPPRTWQQRHLRPGSDRSAGAAARNVRLRSLHLRGSGGAARLLV